MTECEHKHTRIVERFGMFWTFCLDCRQFVGEPF